MADTAKLKIELKDLNSIIASYAQKLNQARLSLESVQATIVTQPFCQSLLDQEKAFISEIEKWSSV